MTPTIWFVIFTVVWYAWLYIKSKNKTSHLPPGPRGLPLVGNLLSLNPELHSYFASLTQTYGPIFKLQLGNKLTIIVSSPFWARQILKDHDITFANHDATIAGRVATYGGSTILWSPYGSQWRILRKVTVLKMLSNTKLDSVYSLRRREVRHTVNCIYSRVGSPVNLGEQAFLITLNVITNMLWGSTVEGEERDTLGLEFKNVVCELTDLLMKPNVSDFYPSLARFDLQGIEKKMNGLGKRFDGIFEKVINQRLKNGKEENKKNNDFLQFLMDLIEERDSKMPITMTQAKALLMDMVVAGTDTSSKTIEFAMAEIINQPEIMKKVQEELESVIGKDNIVEESQIHNLPYLQAVMKETLRLHPTLPLLVPHLSSEACTVGGYTIPKGTRVIVNVWAVHRDPSNWENPLIFDPNRFLNGKIWDYTGNDFNYFPFGSGRRMCVGTGMAERMVMYSLATLLHSFDWKFPQQEAGEEIDLSEAFGLTLKKKIPLVAIPTPRLSHPTLYDQ